LEDAYLILDLLNR